MRLFARKRPSVTGTGPVAAAGTGPGDTGRDPRTDPDLDPAFDTDTSSSMFTSDLLGNPAVESEVLTPTGRLGGPAWPVGPDGKPAAVRADLGPGGTQT